MSETYECDECGACCRTKLVDVYQEDLLREPSIGPVMMKLKEPGLDFEIGYLNCLKEGACHFLDSENRCSIYPTRPAICVLFLAGGEDCQAARRLFEIAPLEPVPSPSTSTANSSAATSNSPSAT